jgi:Bacteriophage CI repressor helix-turn-helix domain
VIGVSGRDLHAHIRARIGEALRSRSWSWLADTAGVPRSTLATQAGRPRFSVEVLVRVADTLEKDVTFFLPAEHRWSNRSDELLREITRLIDGVSEP